MSTNLYSHAEFLRRLARDLVRDAHAADDVVHDAYAEALARGGRFSRAYLAAAVRHKAFKLLRSRKRRTAREEAAARPETCPPAGDLAAEAEIHRAVAAAVAALDAPYRDAILLRYHHGLGPAEIAARVGAPVGTVKTRLRRGLGMLRARLDAAHGGETRSWALALVGLVGVPAPARAATALAGKLAAAALVAAAATTAAVWPREVEPHGRRAEAQAAAPDDVAANPAPEGAPPDPARADAATPAATVMRWPIVENAQRPPNGAAISLRSDHDAMEPPPFDFSRVRGHVEGDELVIQGDMEPAGGNIIAVAPDGALGYVRWNREANWIQPVMFERAATVRVRVTERNGGPVSGVPLMLKEGSTPDAEGRTDANGEFAIDGRFCRFGKVIDAFVAPDAALGTGWLWIGAVDPRRGDGRIDAEIEPLETFSIEVLCQGVARWPDPRPALEGIDVLRGTAIDVETDDERARIGFRARRIRAGAPLRVTLRFRDVEPVVVEIPGNEARCELPVPCAIAGIVHPPPDGEFRLHVERRRGEQWVARASVRTRRRGTTVRYEVESLPPGEYRLFDELSCLVLGPFPVAPGQRLELPPFDLSRCGWVEGRVEPNPPPGYPRVVRPESEGALPHPFGWHIDDGGRFRGRVPGDRTTLLFLESGSLIADPVRVSGPGPVAIPAREGASVLLHIQLPPTSSPEPGPSYMPRALLVRKGEAPVLRELAIDRDAGTATFGGVQPGLYEEVRVFVEPHPWVLLTDVRLRGGRNDLGEIAIPRGSRILVRVRVPEGQAPPRLTVGAWSLVEPDAPPAWTNPEANDVVALGGLGAGRWRVVARPMQAEHLGFEREVAVDGETDVELELDLRR